MRRSDLISGLDRKSAEGLREDAAFYTGRCIVEDAKARDAFLEVIGASLVLLIDWNKTHKVIRSWVSNADVIQVLDWGARHHVGHRGFLEMGGAELVVSAVRHATPARIGFGGRLYSTLGREAVDFLKACCAFARRRCAREALRPRSDEADLVRHLEWVDAAPLAIVIRQAGLAREIAVGIANFVAGQRDQRPRDGAALAAEQSPHTASRRRVISFRRAILPPPGVD